MGVTKEAAVAASIIAGVVLVSRCDAPAKSTCDDSVGPGVACNDPSLCCSWPTAECGKCACDGKQFDCQQGVCSPSIPCPDPATLTPGQGCTGPQLGCFAPSYPIPNVCHSTAPTFPCGAICSCSDGHWGCTPVACPDGGDGGTDDATAD